MYTGTYSSQYYACMCICMYMYLYFIYVNMYEYIYIHLYVYMYIYIYLYIFMCMQVVVAVTSWLGGSERLFNCEAVKNVPIVCDIGPLQGGNRFIFYFGYLFLGCSVISVSFIICMLTLLLMPLAGLHFCVGFDFMTLSL
jgi:hypothetical protein